MSEYQYYEFLALDRPLSEGEQRELRALSSRARISATRFVNTYNFGDFHGDVAAVMARYFDAHLYVANWGTRRVILRWPRTLLDPKVLAPFVVGEGVRSWETQSHVFLELTAEDEGGWVEEDEDLVGSLAAIVPLREDVAAGDLRALYLGWLRAAQSGELEEDVVEPPVPPGLETPSRSLRALADFLRLGEELWQGAAVVSAPLAPEADAEQLAGWVAQLPLAEKDALLARLVTDPPTAVAGELRARFRRATTPAARPRRRRRVGALLEAEEERRQELARAALLEAAAEAERRKRAEAEALERRLRALALRGDVAWSDVEARIATKRAGEYRAARETLGDLRTLALRDGRGLEFAARLAQLRARHARKPSLLQLLADLDGI